MTSTNTTDRGKWRSYLLMVTAIATNLAVVYGVIVPTVGNRPIADFKFPQQLKIDSDRAVIASDFQDAVKSTKPEREIVKAHQKYQYTQADATINLEMSYLVNTRGNVESYLQQYTEIAPEVIEALQIKRIPEVGYHGLLNNGDRAYLSSCISPRSPSNVTQRQFSQYRYQNDLKLEVAKDWLQGKASIRDRRCLWVHLSTPVVTDVQTAYQTLETAWQEIYRWWLPNFPSITNS